MKASKVAAATMLTILFFALLILGPYLVGVVGNQTLGVVSFSPMQVWGCGFVYIVAMLAALLCLVLVLTIIATIWENFYLLLN